MVNKFQSTCPKEEDYKTDALKKGRGRQDDLLESVQTYSVLICSPTHLQLVCLPKQVQRSFECVGAGPKQFPRQVL